MARLFDDDAPSLFRTLELADRCSFSLSELRYRYPAEHRPDGKSESAWLRELTLAGAVTRFGETISSNVFDQIDRELQLIQELDYGGYFLTMWRSCNFVEKKIFFARAAVALQTVWCAFVWGLRLLIP